MREFLTDLKSFLSLVWLVFKYPVGAVVILYAMHQAAMAAGAYYALAIETQALYGPDGSQTWYGLALAYAVICLSCAMLLVAGAYRIVFASSKD